MVEINAHIILRKTFRFHLKNEKKKNKRYTKITKTKAQLREKTIWKTQSIQNGRK